MRNVFFSSLILLSILAISSPAYAYLDPSNGSVLLQGLLASIAGALATIKLYWQKIKMFFKQIKTKHSKEIATAASPPRNDDLT